MERRHLIKRKQVWFVRKRVPPSLRHMLGAEKVRTTGTRDLAEARRRRWTILADIQREIDLARERASAAPGSPEWVSAEARAMLQSVRDGEMPRETLDDLGIDYLLSELVKIKGYKLDDHGHPVITDAKVGSAVHAAAELLEEGPDLIRLSDAITQYLREKAPSIRKQTVNSKRRRLNAFQEWAGDRAVGAITRRDAGRYLSDVLLMRQAEVKTTRDTLSDLSAFFKWASKRGYSDSNPFAEQIGTLSESTRGGVKFTRRSWTPDEMKAMLEGLGRSKPMQDRLWCLLAIAAYSGMRLNEICETELKDVHKTHIHIPTGKTESSVRDVPIHPVLAPLIKKLRGASTDGYLIDGLERGGEDNKRSHYASKRFGVVKRALGVTDMFGPPERQKDRIPFHALRKTFNTALQQAGVSLEVRRAICGHSSAGDTNVVAYTEFPLVELAKAVRKVSYGSAVDQFVRRGTGAKRSAPARS